MRRLACLAATVLLLSGCGASVTPIAATSPPAPSPTSATTTADSPTPVDPTTPPAEPSQPTTGPSIVTATGTAGEQRLALADAFSTGEWSESEVTPAGKAQPQQAMQTVVDCYTDGTAQTIEYRFAQPTGRIVVDVAQAMNSPSAKERLAYSLQTDGRQADSKTIPFTGVATLSSSLAGVTVVTISVKAQDSSSDYRCSDSATAVITKIAVVH